nr:recombinase family protein [Sphingomonas sp.]
MSDGTLERPALQRLLADVKDGRIDIIVVYKVDRLTRSLLDFAKLVEAFDTSNVSFVSITRSFNTATSMGRLTLNMLLSFAQFEREVTAERIRDKIAASKAKGMWMGGTPPLGYRPDGRGLAIVEDHAQLIRDIFARYLALGNVRLLAESLARDRIGAPIRHYGNGRAFGGRPFTRGQLYFILSNPTYIGRIAHREDTHDGLHPPIIALDLWEQAQQQLKANRQGSRAGRGTSTSPLAGKLIDDRGEPLIAVHASKGKQRYRYYVSRDRHHGINSDGWRVPAREIETLVAGELARLFEDPIALTVRAHLVPTPELMAAIGDRAAALARAMASPRCPHLPELIHQIRVDTGRVEIDIDTDTATIARLLEAGGAQHAPDSLILTAPVRLTRTGRVVRLIHQDG